MSSSGSMISLLRHLLRFLLFIVIINENLSASMTPSSSLSSSSSPFISTLDLQFSSPAPFSVPVTAATVSIADLLAALVTAAATTTSSTNSPAVALVNDGVDGVGNGNYPSKGAAAYVASSTSPLNNINNDENNNNNDDDDVTKVAPTSPASVEQQDQPIVPPTTLAFANVAAGNGILMGETSRSGSGSNGGNGSTFFVSDATPPFADVDDKYVPSKPLNLTVLDVTANSITMSWLPPKNQNGAIAGYHVFHIHENQTGVEIVKNSRNSVETTITFVLPKLKPFTDYRVIVKAFTTKNEGEPSDQIIQRTDVGGASAPIVVNLTCHSQDSITIRWKRPYEFYNTIDFYIIKTKLMGQDTHRDIRINASAKELETAMILQNLTTNSAYEVKVAAVTFSVINPKKMVLGKFSEPRKILLQPNCEKIQPLLRQSHNDYNLAVLVGIIFACFGIVLIVMAFFLWSRKCFHAAYYYLDDPPHHPNVPQVDWEVPIEVGGEIRAAVPVNEFAKHVASLHADGDIGFSREYEAIQNECVSDDLPCEHSQHPENKTKNRYLNITAYDHSRVHLHPTPGQKKSLDYINANFIDGYQKSRAFIGTQGPLPDTFDCFWRMIWEQRVAIIVMITNLIERGRRKCDMYWPKDGTETYGVIQVKLIEEEVMATYTVRTLQIKHLKLKKKKQCNSEKIVYQYHYTNWPDHGTPDHPLPVLNFVKKSSAANPPDAGPIVVHCSAGVGRTGTYIVLDAMLKQIQQKGVVNVFGFLRHIRIQRNFLVQTEEQYIFIHDALVEAIASGESNLRAEQIEELKNCTPYLEQQYKNIIQFQTKDIHIASAMKQVNSIKNRGAIFPIEGSRVHLTPKPGEEGSDYINASWLHGFRRLRDFIVTQHPMTHTIKDFWQMVWDHNAQTIVLLSSLDDINFAQFWPDDTTPIESDYYRVKFISKTNKSDYVSRDFVIQSIQDDYELNVKMLHCPSWPEMSNPNSIYDFIVDVHERGNDYRNGPIVVVDRYGGAQACTFCAVSSLAMEMEYCQTANIYQYAKLYHNKRPGVWTSSEDIRLIFNIVSFLPNNLQLLKRTALRTEFEDVTTATPDLYSKICSNGNVTRTSNSNSKFEQQQQLQLQQQKQQQKNNRNSPNTNDNRHSSNQIKSLNLLNTQQNQNQNQFINSIAIPNHNVSSATTSTSTAAATTTSLSSSSLTTMTPTQSPTQHQQQPIQTPTSTSSPSSHSPNTNSFTNLQDQQQISPIDCITTTTISNANQSQHPQKHTSIPNTNTITTPTFTHELNVDGNLTNTNNINFTNTINNAAAATQFLMDYQQMQQQQQQMLPYLPPQYAMDETTNHHQQQPTIIETTPHAHQNISTDLIVANNSSLSSSPSSNIDGLTPLLNTNNQQQQNNSPSSVCSLTSSTTSSSSSSSATTPISVVSGGGGDGNGMLLNHHHHHNYHHQQQLQPQQQQQQNQHKTNQRLSAVTDAQSLDIVG